MWQGFALSILLHAGLALPFFLSLNWFSAKQAQPLVMEFEGEVADQQTQAKTIKTADPSPTLPPIKADEREKKVGPKQRLAPPKPPPKPKPPRTDATEQAEPEVTAPAPAANADALRPTANVQDIQRTISHPMSRSELEQAYARTVSQKIDRKIDCSDFSGKLGIGGVVKVAFVIGESGDLRDDVLRVVKGSGFPEMDQVGLAAVRAAAPFDPPPRQLSFVLDVKCVPR